MQKMIKTNEELEIMTKSGHICAAALKEVLANVKVGATTLALDQIAQREIEKRGGKPSFTTVEDYKWTICTTVNEQVVHGIPTSYKLQGGDVLGIDIGALYNNYHSDLAISVPVGQIDEEKKRFLQTGKNTLEKAIAQAVVGNQIGDISTAIQKGVEGAGYRVVKSLTGHGVGRQLHEDPIVPGYGKPKTGVKILENMVLAIEVIYTNGTGEVHVEDDNWTISASDGTLGGLFEKTVRIAKSGPIVLTPYL